MVRTRFVVDRLLDELKLPQLIFILLGTSCASEALPKAKVIEEWPLFLFGSESASTARSTLIAVLSGH